MCELQVLTHRIEYSFGTSDDSYVAVRTIGSSWMIGRITGDLDVLTAESGCGAHAATLCHLRCGPTDIIHGVHLLSID